jgi:anthranilate phosphoribosyltransferase
MPPKQPGSLDSQARRRLRIVTNRQRRKPGLGPELATIPTEPAMRRPTDPTAPMSISAYLKVIGRGASGARALDRAAAADLMGQVLDGAVSDLEIGAFALAMRMKGETLTELLGFIDAVEQRCQRLHSELPVVVIPSYNGARRLPNLTPLLAMLLAQQGARVLVHGPPRDPTRVGSAEIFHDLGLHAARLPAEVEAAWARREPALVNTATLCAPLQTLLDVRWVVGVRNAGHTVAKMFNPVVGARCLRLASFTHPEFGQLMSEWARQQKVDCQLLRGTEGEPVADPRRQPRIDGWLDGVLRPELSLPAHEGVLSELPLLPRTHDAATTALYIQEVLSGERPAPAPLQRQTALVASALEAIGGGSAAAGQDRGLSA